MLTPQTVNTLRAIIVGLVLASIASCFVHHRLKTAKVYAQVACGGVYHPPVKGPVIVGV